MKYIIYKTTCLVNNKIYIGVHGTENPNIFDGYLGKGFFINKTHYLEYPIAPLHYAIKKYGVSNFKRDILYIFDTEEEAYEKEASIVTEEFINSDKTYNVSIGGKVKSKPTLPVHQFNTNGELVKTYSSVLEASKIINRNISNIYAAITDKGLCVDTLWSHNSVIEISDYNINTSNAYYLYNVNGFLEEKFNTPSEVIYFLNANITNKETKNKIFGYFITTEKYDKLQITVTKNVEKLNRYTLNGIYIDSFSTIKEAKEKLGLKLNNISAAIKLGKSCNGFKWTRGDNPSTTLNIK